MANTRERIPYESEERLRDRAHRNQSVLFRDILALGDDEGLTNVDQQPIHDLAGAGRVKKFRKEAKPPTENTLPTSRQDIVMQPNPPPPPIRRGYPALSKFIGSDKDFFVFRKFNILAARNLLYLQDELSELEEQLDALDAVDRERGHDRNMWSLSSRREDGNIERKSLMKVLNMKMKDYQEALQSQARTLSLEKAPAATIQSVSNWLDNMKPVVETESHFLDDRDDLVSLSNEHATKEFLEQYLENHWHRLFLIKTKKQNKSATAATIEDPYTEYYSTASIKQVARLMICLLAVLLSIMPLPLLSHFTNPNWRLAIIASFTFSFATIFGMLTKSRTSEIFTVMAAYSAFLVVFVGGSS